MKAKFDEDGGLVIVAEDNTEAFALKKWNEGIKIMESENTLSVDISNYKILSTKVNIPDSWPNIVKAGD